MPCRPRVMYKESICFMQLEQRFVVAMNSRGISALLRPFARSFATSKLSLQANSIIGTSRMNLLLPSNRPLPSLSRPPLHALRSSPALQRVWVSTYLQAVRTQRMAMREGAATPSNRDAPVSTSNTMNDIFSKFAAGSTAAAQAPPQVEADASLGTREDRPLFVTTVDASKRRRMPWWATLLGKGLSYWVLLVVVLYLYDQLQQSMVGSANKMVGGRKRSAQVVPEKDRKVFSDVQGVEEAKEELMEVVEFLRNPERFNHLGGKMPKGVLLYGPPGTGKTLLARAVAGEADVPFFYASGSEFDEMFVGVGSARVRELFAAARKNAPAILFLDEFDAVGSKRNPRDPNSSRQTVNQLLAEMDGFSPTEGIIVIAATNAPDSLDAALTRPGRFDKHINVPNPDVTGRKSILAHYLARVKAVPGIDVDKLARGTSGCSGAELSNLVNVAALRAATRGAQLVTLSDLEYAREKILMGPERLSAIISDEAKKITAYHEGGHALVAVLTEGATPVYKATIVPRGGALGMVTQLPDKDEVHMTFQQMLARLDVCMGGRVAEEVVFGSNSITSGASSDLEQATRTARAMVEKFGMSELGPWTISSEKGEVSSETRSASDKAVQRLTQEAYNRSKQLLTTHRSVLDKVAAALLEHETLTGEEIKLLVQGKSINRKS